MNVRWNELKELKIKQINDILQARYGSSVHCQPVFSLTGTQELREGVYKKGHKFYFQVSYREQTNIGSVSLETQYQLSDGDLLGIHELINLILGPLFEKKLKYNFDSYQNNFSTFNHEQNPREMNSGFDHNQNVYSLSLDHAGDLYKPQPISHLLYFYYKHEPQQIKAALMLHEILDYGSFIRFESLAGTLRRAQDLLELGRSIILVSEMTHLNPEDVDILVDYGKLLLQRKPYDLPLLIVSSNQTKEQLNKSWILSESSLSILTQYEILLHRLMLDPTMIKQSLELLLVQ